MDNASLRPEARKAIDDTAARGGKLFVSPITGWEIGLQSARGRFKSSLPPQRWLSQLLSLPHIALADLPPHVLLEASLLSGKLNRDPADRIIAATAREYGYRVVTRDRDLLEYAKQGYLNALPC
jgi:PIN domain nuclease of toxin-antitoxin system